jgi:hypothetical protein
MAFERQAGERRFNAARTSSISSSASVRGSSSRR